MTNRALTPTYRIYFPVEPLLEAAKRRWLDRNTIPYQGDGMLAPILGVTRETITRWKAVGEINLWLAENAAAALGLLPWELWPSYWDDINEFYERSA